MPAHPAVVAAVTRAYQGQELPNAARTNLANIVTSALTDPEISDRVQAYGALRRQGVALYQSYHDRGYTRIQVDMDGDRVRNVTLSNPQNSTSVLMSPADLANFNIADYNDINRRQRAARTVLVGDFSNYVNSPTTPVLTLQAAVSVAGSMAGRNELTPQILQEIRRDNPRRRASLELERDSLAENTPSTPTEQVRFPVSNVDVVSSAPLPGMGGTRQL